MSKLEFVKRAWMPALVLALGCFVGFVIISGLRASYRYRWDTSPCGTQTSVGSFILGDLLRGNPDEVRRAIASDYWDDGRKVYKLIRTDAINFGDPPFLAWQIVMERTPEACAAWIQESGIDLREKK